MGTQHTLNGSQIALPTVSNLMPVTHLVQYVQALNFSYSAVLHYRIGLTVHNYSCCNTDEWMEWFCGIIIKKLVNFKVKHLNTNC